MTKERLKEYKIVELELKQIEGQLEELEAGVYNVSAMVIDGMPKSRQKKAVAGDFSDLLVKLLDLKAYYEKKWDALIDIRTEIEEAISSLPNRERYIFRAKFIEGLKWEEIADKLSYSERQMYRIRNKILKLF